MISSNWAKALEENIKEYIEDGYSEHSDWTPEIYKVSDDSSGILRFHNAFGPSSIPSSSEGAASTEVNITQGRETVVRPQIFKAKMPITEELVRWNKYKGDILDRSKALGSAAIQTINRYGARIFIGGFTSTVTEYGDSEELFSVSHDRVDGGRKYCASLCV